MKIEDIEISTLNVGEWEIAQLEDFLDDFNDDINRIENTDTISIKEIKTMEIFLEICFYIEMKRWKWDSYPRN